MNVVLLKQSSCYLDCYLLHFQTVYFHQLCRKYLINVVPPTRIERATRGLGIVSSPHTNPLRPQKTTEHDLSELVLDGAGLSCSGSSVVADTFQEFSDSVPDDEAG